MADTKPHLFAQTPAEVAAVLGAAGVPLRPQEARRLVAHVLSPNGAREELRRPLKRTLWQAVEAHFDRRRLAVVERAEDPADRFVKYLFEAPDGALLEAVRIPLHKPRAYSVCLSSQVGCAMGCAFCATGRLGLRRNLETWEMVDQLLWIRDEAPGRVTGAVFMGQGEPLANYEAVIQAARVLAHPCAGRLAQEAISISTVGLLPAIRRYTAESHPYRLIVSLTSTVPERRDALLPALRRTDVVELAAALREHAAARGDRVTVAWVLLGGLNHDSAEVGGLARLFAGVPWRLNLIDYNPVGDERYRAATDAERHAFLDALQVLQVPVVRRYSGGQSRHAACGMLTGRRVGLSAGGGPGSEPAPPRHGR